MFQHRDQTEVLFLGTSRFMDGVSPKIVMINVNKSFNSKWSGFNAGTTGSNTKRLELLFNRAIEKEGLKNIVIEISLPQIKGGSLGFGTIEDSTDFEGTLQNLVIENSNLVKWRKSFRIQSLVNMGAILASNQLQGSEIFRKSFVKDYLKKDKIQTSNKEMIKLKPTKIIPTDEIITASKTEFEETILRMQKTAEDKKVNLTFIIPPLVNKRKAKETQNEVLKQYQRIANITGLLIYNYSDLEFAQSLFRDKDSHLNKHGRFIFSTLLAQSITESIQSNQSKQYAIQ